MKEFWKPVKIWPSHCYKFGVFLFGDTVYTDYTSIRRTLRAVVTAVRTYMYNVQVQQTCTSYGIMITLMWILCLLSLACVQKSATTRWQRTTDRLQSGVLRGGPICLWASSLKHQQTPIKLYTRHQNIFNEHNSGFPLHSLKNSMQDFPGPQKYFPKCI